MTEAPTPSKSDTTTLWLTMILGTGAAVLALVQAITRIVEIAPNRDVPVTAAFADTPATMPIGPGGADVQVVAQEVVVLVSDMPAITLASLILAEAVYALAVVATVVLVCLVIRNIIRGQSFASRTVRYVGAVTVVVGIGWALTLLFRTMGANGGAAVLAETTDPVNTAFEIEFVVLFAIVSMGALTAAFQIGHKLQRDAAGLV